MRWEKQQSYNILGPEIISGKGLLVISGNSFLLDLQ
jgi:hypothetical protein